MGSDWLKPSKLEITNYFWRSLIKNSTSGSYSVEIEIRVQTEHAESKVNSTLVVITLTAVSKGK